MAFYASKDPIADALEDAVLNLIRLNRPFTADDAIQQAENSGRLQVHPEQRADIRIYVHAQWPTIRGKGWVKSALVTDPSMPWVYHAPGADLSRYSPLLPAISEKIDNAGRLSIPQYVLRKLGFLPGQSVVAYGGKGRLLILLDSPASTVQADNDHAFLGKMDVNADGRLRVGKQLREKASISEAEAFEISYDRSKIVVQNDVS